MSTGTSLTEKQILTIPKLKKEGYSTIQIAKKLKVTVRTVQNWSLRLRNASYNVPKDKAGKKKVNIFDER